LKASGNDVEAYWPTMFATALKGQNIDELLSAITSVPVSAAGATAAPVAAAAPAKGAESIIHILFVNLFFYREKGRRKEGRGSRRRHGRIIRRLLRKRAYPYRGMVLFKSLGSLSNSFAKVLTIKYIFYLFLFIN
jgi:hypothetical protein